MTSPPARPAQPPRRRRRFSLNALAIQLSAFALSFTLVALLVVSGSQSAFVEPSKALAEYVAAQGTPTAVPDQPRRSRSAPRPAPAPEAPAAPSPPAEEPPAQQPPAVAPAPPERTGVELTDSDAGTALFGVETVLIPGGRADRCIEVTYSGDGNGFPVLLYAASTSGELSSYLDITVEMGSVAPGAVGACGGFTPSTELFTGTLAAFAASHDSYATGLETWTPEEAEDARVFRFGLSLRDDPAAEDRSVAFGFSWETREES